MKIHLEKALTHINSLLKKNQRSYSVKDVTEALDEQSVAMVILLFSLPFVSPITIPGLSCPFGVLLMIVGYRFMRHKRLWLPLKVSHKRISHKHLKKLVTVLESLLKKIRRVTHPRLAALLHPPWLYLNGFLICLQGLMMALPLPIPLANTAGALPVALMAIGLLLSDGLFILFSYLASLLAIAFFVGLFWLGVEGFDRIAPL